MMKRSVELFFAAGIFAVLVLTGCHRESTTAPSRDVLDLGRELFARHCSGCHPDGGNTAYPQKTLHRFDLSANGITTPSGIVAKMRHPDPGMRQFDRSLVSDRDAMAIAQYILATFR